MKILLVGENARGYALGSIYANLIKLGAEAEMLNTHDYFKTSFANRVLNRFLKTPHYFGSGVKKINKLVLERVSGGKFDFVFFVKPLLIYPGTIAEIRKYSKVIGFTMDHAGILKTNSDYFYESMLLFDLYLTAVPDNVDIMMGKYGFKKALFLRYTADPACHHPVNVSAGDTERLGADVVFLGTYARGEKRVEYMERLCREGYDVKIYGNSWEKLPKNSCLRSKGKIIPGNTPCEEMAKVIGGSKITLAFMREQIKEPTACRTYEIALCGGFMLHERTKEAEELLAPGKGAEFFGSYEEMKSKIDFYLKHPELRLSIAKEGERRVLNCGELIPDMVKKMLEILKKEIE